MLRNSQLFRVLVQTGIASAAAMAIAGCGGGGSVPSASVPATGGAANLAQPGSSLKTESVTADSKGNLAVQVPYHVGGQWPVSFITFPKAACHRTGDTSANPWTVTADSTGHVSFYISISDNAAHQDALTCAGGGGSQTVNLAYVNSSAQLAPAISAPVAMPSEPQIESVVASLGFDPRTADNSVLEAHNLPPRAPDFATNPAASVGWLKAVFSPTTSLITNSTDSVNVPGVYHKPAMGQHNTIYNGTVVSTQTSNWSGYDDAGVQGTYNTVRAYWTVPSLSPTAANPAYSSMWVGIDGGICADTCNDTVFQDGTEQEYYTSGGVGYYYYEGWWEYYPSNAQQNLFSVHPGDEMYGTFWKNVSGGSVYGQYYLKDITTGSTSNFAIYVGSALRGDSVEWVVERPSVGGSFPPLADYRTAGMTQAELISGSSTIWYDQIPGLSSYNMYQIAMVNGADLLSEVTDPYPDTGAMTFTWYNSQ